MLDEIILLDDNRVFIKYVENSKKKTAIRKIRVNVSDEKYFIFKRKEHKLWRGANMKNKMMFLAVVSINVVICIVAYNFS